MSAGTQLQPFAQPLQYFSTTVAMARESPPPHTPTRTHSPPFLQTSILPGSSVTPHWQGCPPVARWWGGPVPLHCGMQWGWQQCVKVQGPAGKVWAGCYTVCRLPRSSARFDAGMVGESFLGFPWIGCPLLSPTAHRSTLHLGPHLMECPPAALERFKGKRLKRYGYLKRKKHFLSFYIFNSTHWNWFLTFLFFNLFIFF